MNKPYFDPGRRNATGGLGQWLIQNGDGTETLLEGAIMATQEKRVAELRDSVKEFVTAWRKVRGVLEDWKIDGMLPPAILALIPDGADYDSEKVVTELVDSDVTPEQVYAGVGSMMVIGNIGATDVKNIVRIMTK